MLATLSLHLLRCNASCTTDPEVALARQLKLATFEQEDAAPLGNRTSRPCIGFVTCAHSLLMRMLDLSCRFLRAAQPRITLTASTMRSPRCCPHGVCCEGVHRLQTPAIGPALVRGRRRALAADHRRLVACKAALVDVSAVNYAVPVERQSRRILRDVGLKVEAGSLHMLVGPNGCGKVR